MAAAGMVLVVAFILWSGPAVAVQQGFAARLQRGVELLAANRPAEAIVELEAAVDEQPASPEARYHLGRALFMAGRAAEAAPHLEAALQAAAEPGPVQFLLAQVWLQLDDLEAAAAALEAASAARADFPPIDYYRAELCYRLGKVGPARSGFAVVAGRAPQWNLPLVRSGMLALEERDAEQAVDWFQRALALGENNATLWMRLGSALVQAQQPQQAVAAYRRATELGPQLIPARVALATQLDNIRDYDGARAALDDLFAVQPDHPLGHYQLARMLSLQGNDEEALAAVDVAIRGFDAQAQAGKEEEGEGRHTYRALSRSLRARLLMKLGRNDEAEETARRVIESDPWYHEPYFIVGTLLVRRGDPEGEALLRRFKALTDAREHREQGEHFLESGEAALARPEFEAALEAIPDDAAALVGLASALRLTDDPAAALVLLDRVSPTGLDAVAWYRERILTLGVLGRDDAVQAAWQAARAAGLTFGPDVWRIVHAGKPGC